MKGLKERSCVHTICKYFVLYCMTHMRRSPLHARSTVMESSNLLHQCKQTKLSHKGEKVNNVEVLDR